MAVASSKTQALNDIFRLVKFKYTEVRYFKTDNVYFGFRFMCPGYYGLMGDKTTGKWVFLASSYEKCLKELRHHFDMLEGFEVVILEEILRSVKL